MAAKKRTSKEFLDGMSLLMELGVPLDKETVPGLLEAIEKIDTPTQPVKDIKTVLETLKGTDYSSRLGMFTQERITEILARGTKTEPAVQSDYSGWMHC